MSRLHQRPDRFRPVPAQVRRTCSRPGTQDSRPPFRGTQSGVRKIRDRRGRLRCPTAICQLQSRRSRHGRGRIRRKERKGGLADDGHLSGPACRGRSHYLCGWRSRSPVRTDRLFCLPAGGSRGVSVEFPARLPEPGQHFPADFAPCSGTTGPIVGSGTRDPRPRGGPAKIRGCPGPARFRAPVMSWCSRVVRLVVRPG
jgi:hypothetical protein